MPAAVYHPPLGRLPGALWRRAALGVLCLCLLSLPGHSLAQSTALGWQPLGGPGGRILIIASNATGMELYAVAVSGVQRADDQTQAADTAYVVGYALYRSVNGGATWQPATNNLPQGAISALYADPATGMLYSGLEGSGDSFTRRYGLWRSADRGSNWEQVNLGREDLIVRSITRSADARTLYVGAVSGARYPVSYVFRSKDDGLTWTSSEVLHFEQAPGSTLVELLADPRQTARLYASTAGGQVYVSADEGQTWGLPPEPPAELTPGTSVSTRLVSTPDEPAMMLLARSTDGGTSLRLDLSRDAGATWSQQAGSGLPARASANALIALPSGVFLLNTSAGTYRSTNQGSTWQALEGPLSSREVNDFARAGNSPSDVFAATSYGLFASRDAGALWQTSGDGLPVNSRVAGLLTHAQRPELLYALSGDGALVLRSTDRGRTWTPAARGVPADGILTWALDPADPNSIYIGSYGQLLHSLDGGVSWQTLPLGTPSLNALAAIAIAPSNGRVIYVGGRPARRSSDGGQTWREMAMPLDGEVVGLAVDPGDAEHVWAGFSSGGVFESNDGGRTWRDLGLGERPIRWLVAATGGSLNRTPENIALYAGVTGDGIYRRTVRSAEALTASNAAWTAASTGLPAGSTVLALAPDPRSPGMLWASRDRGGIFRSTDGGVSWVDVGVSMGDNVATSLAVDYNTPGGLYMGTATAGVWLLRPSSSGRSQTASLGPQAVDARIEVVWPHDWASAAEAKLANIGVRLFAPGSLVPPPCAWRPDVHIWQAVDTNPAEPLGVATQRSVNGQPYPYWDLNDVDVRIANDPGRKLYFMVQVEGVNTATGIWAHGSDPLTSFPQQDVPSGLATDEDIAELDARIEIVWPHDETGMGRPVIEGTFANVAVELFKHGTRLSVPVGWQPAGITLYGAWNQEIGAPVSKEATVQVRQSGAITYPIWEFQNIPVARATNAANKLYLWVMVDGVTTYPTIWAHGADARTFFPIKDEPIQGCMP